MKSFILAFALFSVPGFAAELTPILVSNGEAKIVCDGQMRHMNTTPLVGRKVIGTYLFGNLVTHSGFGADVILWSPSYSARYAAPYTGGPSSKWGSLGDLHIFAQPAGHTGGRQGQSERWFPAGSAITISDHVELVVICWGGGTLELYAMIWVE